jgi:ATP-dependent helicase/nuclease subunit A
VSAADAEARERIVSDLASTLFVTAGAGSGKTSTLVDRVAALVETGTSELERVAAITFTEKAAAELRDRIRERLDRDSDNPLLAARRQRALAQLDRAPVGTLHSFARRILAEHPVEAGLPPRIEVMDEVGSGVDFEQRFRAFHGSMLEDPSMQRTLLLLLASGVGDGVARDLAQLFEASWDLVEDYVPESSPEPPSPTVTMGDVLRILSELQSLAARCTETSDRLLDRIHQVAARVEQIRTAGDEMETMRLLALDDVRFTTARTGRQAAWPGGADQARQGVADLGEALRRARCDVLDACAHRLGSAVRRFTLDSAAQRRAAGRLQFHDLLVMARALLRDPEHGATVRSDLSARYDHVLLDELQDTDPIQIDLAVRIAAADPATAGAAPWEEIEVAPGRLFMVGDAKQSIYRFRRADIATFLAAQQRFAAGAVSLTTNFRSVGPIVDWVNATFAALFSSGPAIVYGAPSQPVYEALAAYRELAEQAGDDGLPGAGGVARAGGPAVAVVGRRACPANTKADQMRALEADAVAGAVRRAVDECWTVRGADGSWRPARLGDITILVPARTSLPFLEDALEDSGVAFRAESSSLVYASREVRDLVMVVRALDDPTDHLTVVAALRTPLLACGDDDLWRFRVERGGHWNFARPHPGTVPAGDPVRLCLDYLRSMHEERAWLSPAEVIDRVARDRRAFELGHATGRERDVWRRLRYVIDQARAWSEATGGNLRQYLAWVRLQASDSARTAEPVLPESDHDAVRIMTIHAAKGLEFPITILSGMSTSPQQRFRSVDVVFPRTGRQRVAYRLGRDAVTQEFSDNQPIDEQMSLDERIRLLYVAATRARDHLVVSVYRRERKSEPNPGVLTNAELVVRGMGEELLEAIPDGDVPDGSAPDEGGVTRRRGGRPAPPAPAPVPLVAPGEWERDRVSSLARASRPTTVAATALSDEGNADHGEALDEGTSPKDTGGAPSAPDFAALDWERGRPDPGLQKRPRDLDLPPWLKGRYGTSVGRAVHGVLQTIDLANGLGRESAVAAQCEAEGIPDRAADVTLLVEHALTSPIVRAAAASRHWREVYACVPMPGGRLIEGYIDLLFRGSDGLVVVDYKTASTDDPADLERRVEGYRWQGAAYAVAVEAATGAQVHRVVFVFLTPHGAIEHQLADLRRSMTVLESRVEAGHEVVSS